MPRFISEIKRTNTCGELTQADVGKEVVLFGWVNNRRDHGGAVFIDLRDRDGVTQVVFEQDVRPEVHELAGQLRLEYCVGIRGKVVSRGGNANPKLRTGEIEVHATDLEIFNRSEPVPFPVEDSDRHERGEAAPVPLPRPAPGAPPEDAHDARPGEPPHPELLHRPPLPRARDAVHGEVHARAAPATSSSRRGSTRASSTRSRRARSSTSSSTWSRGSSGTSRSSAASATRTSGSTGSPSSPRSTSRCRSSSRTTCST